MASGEGKRFGSNKLLAPFGGKCLIEHILDASEGVFERRVVVTRHAAVQELCRKRQIDVILHELPYRNDTVRLGVTALRDMERICFCPSDQPFIQKETFTALLQAMQRKPHNILRTVYEGQMGAPVGFPAEFFDELCRLPQGKGGGYLTKKYADRVDVMAVKTPQEMMDIDTQEDLVRMERYLPEYRHREDDMREAKAVVFDMDGVIFDSEREVMEAWKVVAEKYGILHIEDVCRRCLGCTYDRTREIMHEIYGDDFPYEAYKKEASDIFHERNDGGRLPKKSGIVDFLQWLKERHIPVALASSTRREVVVQELTEGGIIAYFDQLICGDMVEKSKPAPDIFLKACAALGIEPAHCVAVEDSYNGIRAAHAAGMITVMVPDLMPPDEEMRQKADAILANVSELKEKLFFRE